MNGEETPRPEDELRAAWGRLRQSLSSTWDEIKKAVNTDGNDHTAWFEADKAVPVTHDYPELASSLIKASGMAGGLYAYLQEIKAGQASPLAGRGEKRRLYTAMRWAVTLRDSLDQMAQLVAGEELEEPDERTFTVSGAARRESDDLPHVRNEVVEVDGDSTDWEAAVSEAIAHMPRNGQQIRSAFAYSVMKRIRREIIDKTAKGVVGSAEGDHWADDLQEAMSVISGHIEVPTGDKQGDN